MIGGGNAVDRVLAQAREAEQLAHALAVDRHARARHRAASERALVGRLVRRQQPPRVALDVVVHRQQVMPQRRRLGVQQVRVAGHDGLGLGVGAIEQRASHAQRAVEHTEDRVAHDQAVQGLGPGAAEVEVSDGALAAGHAPHESALHVQVEVLDRRVEWPHGVGPFAFDLIQPAQDRCRRVAADDLAFGQHRQPRSVGVDERIEVVPAVELEDRLEDPLREHRVRRGPHPVTRAFDRFIESLFPVVHVCHRSFRHGVTL